MTTERCFELLQSRNESIAISALHIEILGMEKHIVTLLYGPMTAEQKSTVKKKSTIQPHHVLRALEWLI